MVEPLPSATVVLARDSEQGPELLLVKRRSGDAFGEAYTFPGGVLDADESNSRSFCDGLPENDADALLGVDSGGLDFFNAVTRELFEETGVLLGSRGPVNVEFRDQLCAGRDKWPDILERLELSVPCNALHYFAHWITPETLPKRWTTRFFLAAMPEQQTVTPDGSEVTDFCWLTPRGALAAAGSGERDIPFPTLQTVRWLDDMDSVAAMIEWARQRQAHGITPILPTIGAEGGQRRIFMPDVSD